jgi:hypothetical protein
MTRPRATNAVLLVAMIVGAIVTYGMKHQAEVAAEGVARLQADIASERDKIRTLNAEWAFLNQPSRLEALAKEHADYFRLTPFSPDQLAAIDEIPMRAAPAAAVTPTAGGVPSTDSIAVQATLARIAAGGALRQR